MAQGAVTMGAIAGLDGRAMSRGTITLADNPLTTAGGGALSTCAQCRSREAKTAA